MRTHNLLLFTCVWLLTTAQCLAQTWKNDTIVYTHPMNLSVEQPLNEIANAIALTPFFEKLFMLKRDGRNVVNVLHVGDSHIQADYMTAVVRRAFQSLFGSAGRGLLVPLAVAGTNGPVNFISKSSTAWQVKRCVQPALPGEVGIGGITITTSGKTSDITFLMNDLWTEQLIKNIDIFYTTRSDAIAFEIADEYHKPILKKEGRAGENVMHFELPTPARAIDIKTTSPSASNISYFGVNVRNGESGVLYHAVGVNGARYQHYNLAKHFKSQTKFLEPDLIIISLGTNESTAKVDEAVFDQEIEKLVTGLQSANPDAVIMLVTPPNALENKNPNTRVAIVRSRIVEFAVANGLAFYDLNKIMGGPASALVWKSKGLMRPDGVHFTKEAYEQLGSLFFAAFVKHYNKHVSLRHP